MNGKVEKLIKNEFLTNQWIFMTEFTEKLLHYQFNHVQGNFLVYKQA